VTLNRWLAAWRSGDRVPMAAIFALALALRVAGAAVAGDRELAFEWAVIVPSMLAGRGFTYYHVDDANRIVAEPLEKPRATLPSAYMPPAYAFFLAGVGLVFGIGRFGVAVAEIFQAGLGAATCLLLYRIAVLKFDRRVAIGAALVLAVYPLAVYASSQISAVTLYVFLGCLFVWLACRAEAAQTVSSFAWAGLALGFLILARAEVLLFLPFFLLWVRIASPARFRSAALALAVAAMVPVGGWLARNWHAFGRPVPITIVSGLALWEGHNPEATGTRSDYTAPPVEVPADLLAQIDALPATRDYELRRDDLFMRTALDAIRDNPLRSAALGLRKFVFYWGYYWGIDFTYPGAKSPLYWLPWFLLLPWFVVGVALTVRRFAQYSLFYIYFVLATAMATTFFVIPRYRLFILPLVILFAVHGAYASLASLAARLRARPAS
jgi:4-amino-4-deoxy-L-arabinose transferase-like glycosyltransferase